MELVPYVAAAEAFLRTHPGIDTCGGMFLAVLGSHPFECADAVAGFVAKVPPLKYLLKKNWPAIKEFLDKFEERFGADLQDPEPVAASAEPQKAV